MMGMKGRRYKLWWRYKDSCGDISWSSWCGRYGEGLAVQNGGRSNRVRDRVMAFVFFFCSLTLCLREVQLMLYLS